MTDLDFPFLSLEGTTSPKHNDVATFIMTTWVFEDKFPTAAQIQEEFKLTEAELRELEPQVNVALTKKGWDPVEIFPKPIKSSAPTLNKPASTPVVKKTRGNQLDPFFVMACELLVDSTDKRSKAAKLKAASISSLRFSKLLEDKKHQKYFNDRIEAFKAKTAFNADIALGKNVEAGDLQSIKYFNEFTGRFKESNSTVDNLMILLARMMEVLSKHVEPGTLSVIANELDQVLEIESGPQ